MSSKKWDKPALKKIISGIGNQFPNKQEQQPESDETPFDKFLEPTEEEKKLILKNLGVSPEEKKMNFKWKFEFVLTTGILKETVTSEVCTEIDSERVAFGLALNKVIGSEKYKSSTGVPRYTQKFTKEKINQG